MAISIQRIARSGAESRRAAGVGQLFIRLLWVPLYGSLCFALLTACGDDEPSGPSYSYEVDLEQPPPEPLVLSATSCQLDIDCQSGLFCFQGACTYQCADDTDCGSDQVCSSRGRCLDSAAEKSADEAGSVIDVLPGITITDTPDRQQFISLGQTELSITFGTNSEVPEGRIYYRAERTDSDELVPVLETIGDDSFTIVLPTGIANPAEVEAGPVYVDLITSVGSVRLDLIPNPPFSGTYSGEVSMEGFGSVGLPIEMQIVTDPADASLETADHVWLVLPVADDRLFSPHERFDDETTFVTHELVFDEFVERWVAVFEHEFRFGDDTVFAQAEPGQIERTIRVELEAFDVDQVIGSISDRWTGLYDVRSAEGVRALQDVVFEGDFETYRAGPAAPLQEVTPPVTLPDADPALLPLPSVDACSGLSVFAPAPVTIGAETYDCSTVADLSAFLDDASTEERTDCAIAIADTALSGETTSAQINAFLDGTPSSPGGLSFAEFMAKCASGEDGICVPAAEVLCARQLLAYTNARRTSELVATPVVVDLYGEATREAFLGRQLAAFQTDATMRLEWLETTDYPAIITSQVRTLIEGLLDDWRDNVLDVHMDVLQGQFDPSGLAVLSQEPSSEATADIRRQLLMEMSSTWLAAMDALTIAAMRWNELYQDGSSRLDRAEYVQTRLLDLYLLAGVLFNLNRDAGMGSSNAGLAGGFGHLMRELNQLTSPFSLLVFARDAEVVVSNSLDPNDGDDTVLSNLEADALQEIASAEEAVTTLLAEAQARALNEQQLRNELSNQITQLRSELVDLCGLPVGCTAGDLDESDCAVQTAAGFCGFSAPRGSPTEVTGVSASEAGGAYLAIEESIQARRIAEEELRAHNRNTGLLAATAEAFAATLQDWNNERRQLAGEIAAIVAEQNMREQQTAARAVAILDEQMTLQAELLDRQESNIARWNSMRIGGIETNIASLATQTALESTAMGLETGAQTIDHYYEVLLAGVPSGIEDPFFLNRMQFALMKFVHSEYLYIGATAMNIAAHQMEVERERLWLMGDAELEALQDEAAFDEMAVDQAVRNLSTELRVLAQLNQYEVNRLERLIEATERMYELQWAYERDIIELEDRRNRWKMMLEEAIALEIRVLEADLALQQRIISYLQVAQRAQLMAAQLDELELQREQINLLLGSPSAVFAWANRLSQAESRLERAKDKLMDWLVALEYFAVRPFMDQRIQILLARNTYQLEEIAADLRRLQRSCGGPVNLQVSTVSVAELLWSTFETADDDGLLTPQQRFRAVLEAGVVPIDKRTRYTADDTIGDLLDSRDVWAATFDIGLDRFANLATTCNAKVVSVEIVLVGDELGTAQPTVSLLYDGTSRLRSCQPGLDEYLDLIGRDATAFDTTTTFRTAGRSISPVARINAFDPEGTPNTSLSGLPLASQYTILIDTEIGENAQINWENLDDVQLRIEYGIQDIFPEGQCE